jgi:methyl-accepting chemotaxis protein
MKFAAIVVCVVVFTGAVGAYSYADTNAKLEDDVNADLQTNAAAQADTVSLWVDQRRQTARMISKYEVMNLGVSAQIDRFLNGEIDELHDDVHEVHYVDAASNETLASTADESKETVVTAEEAAWASGDRSFDGPQDVYRSDMYIDDGVPTISFVSPVAGRESVLVVVNADASADPAATAATDGGRGGKRGGPRGR